MERTEITPDDIPLTQGELEMLAHADDPLRTLRAQWPAIRMQPNWVENWLQGQFSGEVDAVASMEDLLATFLRDPTKGRQVLLLERIVRDERDHVLWIGQLLQARGVKPRAIAPGEVLPGMDTCQHGCAVASRAEALRAGEIRLVIADEWVPTDVRDAFRHILGDEVFHERAFRRLAGDPAMVNHRSFTGWNNRRELGPLLAGAEEVHR